MNLASCLLLDAAKGNFEQAVIVSNDSDLVTPIKMTREIFKKKIGILNPQKEPSHLLAKHADFLHPIREGVLKVSRLPDIIHDAQGSITCPQNWR